VTENENLHQYIVAIRYITRVPLVTRGDSHPIFIYFMLLMYFVTYALPVQFYYTNAIDILVCLQNLLHTENVL